MNKDYDDFSIGEIYVFDKTFSQNDFEVFSSFSGDTNPLHHDSDYAKNTNFKQIIVPLHLAASPLSKIAGVIFPGNKSLYLWHELKALKPVPYETRLTYSAKIIGKNQREKILTVRTVVFGEQDVYIEATQQIKVRDDDLAENDIPDTKNLEDGSFLLPTQATLITEANGEIGSSIALKLARKGKKLVLNFKQKDARAKDLISRLEGLDAEYEILEIDLSAITDGSIRKKLQSLTLNIGTIIHAACPPVDSSLSEHMKVNFESLKLLFENLRHTWLSLQFGHIIFISSSATHFYPQGWENYVAAKSATENYLQGIFQTYGYYGLTVNVLATGIVEDDFSGNLDLSDSETILPEQIATEVISISENPEHFYTWLEVNFKKTGTIGFIEHKANTKIRSKKKAT